MGALVVPRYLRMVGQGRLTLEEAEALLNLALEGQADQEGRGYDSEEIEEVEAGERATDKIARAIYRHKHKEAK